jgi:hypothetical protein
MIFFKNDGSGYCLVHLSSCYYIGVASTAVFLTVLALFQIIPVTFWAFALSWGSLLVTKEVFTWFANFLAASWACESCGVVNILMITAGTWIASATVLVALQYCALRFFATAPSPELNDKVELY